MISQATVELAPEHACMTLEDITCNVYNGGQMSGFIALCAGHATRGDLLARAWARMHDVGVLNAPGDTDVHGEADVALSIMLILRGAQAVQVSDQPSSVAFRRRGEPSYDGMVGRRC